MERGMRGIESEMRGIDSGMKVVVYFLKDEVEVSSD